MLQNLHNSHANRIENKRPNASSAASALSQQRGTHDFRHIYFFGLFFVWHNIVDAAFDSCLFGRTSPSMWTLSMLSVCMHRMQASNASIRVSLFTLHFHACTELNGTLNTQMPTLRTYFHSSEKWDLNTEGGGRCVCVCLLRVSAFRICTK